MENRPDWEDTHWSSQRILKRTLLKNTVKRQSMIKVEKRDVLLECWGDICNGPLRLEEKAEGSSTSTLYYIYYRVYVSTRIS